MMGKMIHCNIFKNSVLISSKIDELVYILYVKSIDHKTFNIQYI